MKKPRKSKVLTQKGGINYVRGTARGIKRQQAAGAAKIPIRSVQNISKIMETHLKQSVRDFSKRLSKAKTVSQARVIYSEIRRESGALRESRMLRISSELKRAKNFILKSVMEATPQVGIPRSADFNQIVKKHASALYDGASEITEKIQRNFIKDYARSLKTFGRVGSSKRLAELTKQVTDDMAPVSKYFARNQMQLFNKDVTVESYKKGGIEQVQWRVIGDVRTRPSHKLLDKKIFDIDKLPKEAKDYNCRCVLVPIFKKDDGD